MDQRTFENATPQQALRIARLLWAALLVGPVAFAGVVAYLTGGRPASAAPDQTVKLLFYVNIAVLGIGVVAAYFIRNQFYKRHWEGDVIKPTGYVSGNLIVWAVCEGCAFFSLVVCLLGQTFWPYVAPAVAALAVQVVNWPTGQPMMPPRQTLDRYDADD